MVPAHGVRTKESAQNPLNAHWLNAWGRGSPPSTGSTWVPLGATGTGLGLALCRDIALTHGGRFTLSRRTGGGAVARVELPAC